MIDLIDEVHRETGILPSVLRHALTSKAMDEYMRIDREKTWDDCLTAIEENQINTDQAREGNPYRRTSSDSGAS